ncbi:hypothetical protein I7I50_03298 [Histoplasma capsulatum G186AR]|uniref:Uncharacterized protein n=1 Tax=Ajellomyces capsulatus TaxID=5037 RepID=A0A8H8D698_AJECA|nr:hypothetical protein I7I52_00033 [Histoplasma capsulatum]QSS72199.1 hypothetical protein I7I50_03298 [Histoplasma capsulatum G186AR]
MWGSRAKLGRVASGSRQGVKRKPIFHNRVQKDSHCPSIGRPTIVCLSHEDLRSCIVFTATSCMQQRACWGFRDAF